jgi:hypothetical protein
MGKIAWRDLPAWAESALTRVFERYGRGAILPTQSAIAHLETAVKQLY